MPKVAQRHKPQDKDNTPDTLKPYLFHGIDLQYTDSSAEAKAECPFCTKNKFSVNVETGQWKCWACGGDEEKGGGNLFTFLRRLHKVSLETTRDSSYEQLANQKNIDSTLAVEILRRWGFAKSITTGFWLLPGYATASGGKLTLQQLYSYEPVGNGKHSFKATTKCKHTLMGLNRFINSKPDVWLCEGPWDAVCLTAALMRAKMDSTTGELMLTSNEKSSLFSAINILAVPGCNTFFDHWAKWFKDKTVNLLYDNDHPRETPTGSIINPVGTAGMERACSYLGDAKLVNYIHWGEHGFDPELPNGYDLRDLFADQSNDCAALSFIDERLQEAPQEWLLGLDKVDSSLVCRECSDWNKLTQAWRKAMKWTPGLDHGLASMLACIASTKSMGDQLWLKVISPASSGKSTLCEALSVNKQHTLAKSTIRGFHSGYKMTDDDKEDNSLLSIAMNKTLITKDGDTLLQAPNLSQILSEARDVYDGVSRTHYRNKASRDYENFRLTWLLCGTNSLRSLDSSELGARFLDCVIMDRIDEDLEDEILWRVANKSADHVAMESGAEGADSNSQSTELKYAMELTGGYITWLRDNAYELLPQIKFDHEAKQQCLNFGKFVAYMRARPSKLQAERAERELAARLVSQHVRYARSVAFVTNQMEVNASVLERTKRICLDTARGVVLDVVHSLYRGAKEARGLLLEVSCSDAELRTLMRFLREIKVVQFVNAKHRKVWQLTPQIKELYECVVSGKKRQE